MDTETALPPGEQFAADHADQWVGCVPCQSSHHTSAFCHNCGSCFFQAEQFENTEIGDFVTCGKCGQTELWD